MRPLPASWAICVSWGVRPRFGAYPVHSCRVGRHGLEGERCASGPGTLRGQRPSQRRARPEDALCREPNLLLQARAPCTRPTYRPSDTSFTTHGVHPVSIPRRGRRVALRVDHRSPPSGGRHSRHLSGRVASPADGQRPLVRLPSSRVLSVSEAGRTPPLSSTFVLKTGGGGGNRTRVLQSVDGASPSAAGVRSRALLLHRQKVEDPSQLRCPLGPADAAFR